MLHLPPDKNKLHNEKSDQPVKDQMTEYKIDNRSIYNILDRICKDIDLYSYVKQHKSRRNKREVFYVIYSRWLGLNHVNKTASEAELWRHGTGRNMLPNMSSTILSKEI